MKKALAMVLILLMLFSACAESSSFSFRNGISWGMSPEDVLKAEGDPAHETDEDDDTLKIEIKDVDFGSIKCDLEYAFLDDMLFMAVMEFDTRNAQVSFNDLRVKLTQTYGEPGEFSDAVKAELTEDEIAELDTITSWKLADGTDIWLMEDSEDQEIQIMFVDLGF